jgi:dCMP deaminase
MGHRFEKFLPIARAISALSKDPSTKVGCLALNDDGIVLAVGYNGFPRNVNDSPQRYEDRDTKYKLISHAEQNLVAQAAYAGHSLKGATVVLSGLYPCSNCAKSLIQSGVKRIITPRPGANPRWSDDSEWSKILFSEASVEIIHVEDPD